MLYRFDQHELDTSRFALLREGEPVELEPRVLKLLTLLIENRERVVSRDELHERLWGRRVVTENALNVCIRAVRRAVNDTGGQQSKIRTVHGTGYQFVADVASRSPRLAEIREVEHEDSQKSGNDAAVLPDRAMRGRPSIAIMPFETIGTDEAGTIVSRGLVHDVITRIARSRLMFVISRGTTFNFPHEDYDVARIGQALAVRYVVQGAVQADSSRLKVSVALASALTREELWAEQFERRLDDFMRVQEEIAEMIGRALELQIEKEEVRRSLLMPSTNLDAWSAYHRGLHHMYHFRFEECDRAEHFFRRSIDLEPKVPRPYAGLSFIQFERVFLGFERKPEEGIRRSLDLAEQSLAIDGLDPMGHWALARAQFLHGELELAKSSLQTAIDLNPSYAIAQYSLGWLAMQIGEHELCREKIELAQRLSPFDPLKFAMLGVSALNMALMGQTRAAAERAQRSMSQPNAHFLAASFAAVTHALDGQLDKARKYMCQVRAVLPGYDLPDFLKIFPFRNDADLKRLRKAFDDMRPPRMH